jgi:hypothetical protein
MSRPSYFTPQKENLYPLNRRLGGPRSEWLLKISLLVYQLWFCVHPMNCRVHSHGLQSRSLNHLWSHLAVNFVKYYKLQKILQLYCIFPSITCALSIQKCSVNRKKDSACYTKGARYAIKIEKIPNHLHTYVHNNLKQRISRK